MRSMCKAHIIVSPIYNYVYYGMSSDIKSRSPASFRGISAHSDVLITWRRDAMRLEHCERLPTRLANPQQVSTLYTSDHHHDHH
jgi:hypothetical protein